MKDGGKDQVGNSNLVDATWSFISKINCSNGRLSWNDTEKLRFYVSGCKKKYSKGDKTFDNFTGSELGVAVLNILDFINANNPEKLRQGERTEKIDSAVNANRFFLKFFLDAMQIYKIDDSQIGQLFKTVFNDSFCRMLEGSGINGFDMGIASVVKAARCLIRKNPNRKVQISSLEEDRDWGVDMILIEEDGKRILIGVKSKPVKGDGKSKIYVLGVEDDRKRLEAFNQTITIESVREERGKCLSKIDEYSKDTGLDAWWLDIL